MVNYILAGMLLFTIAIAYRQHGKEGIKSGLVGIVKTVAFVAPFIFLGVVLAGLLEVVLPQELISEWMGEDSGITGVLIGTVVGILVPGGPYVVVPLLASVMETGAGVGPVAAFFTAWGVIPLTRTIAWEIPFLGVNFTAARFTVNLGFPIVVGIVTPWLMGLVT